MTRVNSIVVLSRFIGLVWFGLSLSASKMATAAFAASGEERLLAPVFNEVPSDAF